MKARRIKEILENIKASKQIHGVILYGPPGQGKTTIASEFADVIVKGGRITPFVLFQRLYENKDKVILIDDFNRWDDETAVEILKQALDDKDVRVVEWNTTYARKQLGVERFVFEGKIIITTNVYPEGALVDALRDRVLFVEVDLSDVILKQFPEELRPLVREARMVSWRFLNLYRENPELFRRKLEEVLNLDTVKQVVDAWKRRESLRLRGYQPWDYLGISRSTFFRKLALARKVGMLREVM